MRNLLRLLPAFAVWLLTATAPRAADETATWTNTATGGGNWSDAGNWLTAPGTGLVPNNGGGFVYDVTLANGGTAILDVDVVVRNLTFGSSSTTTIGGGQNLTVNGLLTWGNGTIG